MQIDVRTDVRTLATRAIGRSLSLQVARVIAVIMIALFGAISGSATASAGMVKAPEGNRNATQPDIPFASARRTAAFKATYDVKFKKIVRVFRRDDRLVNEIKSVAKIYGIDPIHMIGAIVGEHTYNYGAMDSAQSYYIKAAAYAGIDIRFQYDGEPVSKFIERKQFDRCHRGKMDSDTNVLWSCYERVWNNVFRGRVVDKVSYPATNFNQTFFQPLFAGQSFGLGQLTPLTIMKMSDRVARVSGLPKLDPNHALGIYQAAMDPDISLHYIAAVIQDAIEAYKDVAKVDITNNPGLTATLYNLGSPWERAARYVSRRARGTAVWPEENYYGWLVNDRIDDLKALL